MKNIYEKIKNIKLKNKQKMFITITLSIVGITTISLIIWKATSGKTKTEKDNQLNENSSSQIKKIEKSEISKITKEIKLLKETSIETYGNLFGNTTSIKVDYNGTDYVFQIGKRKEIININNLNTQLNLQKSSKSLKTFNYLDINQLIQNKKEFNFDNHLTLEKAKAKSDSFIQYGDLKNNINNIDYQNDKFIFWIDEKEKINGLKDYKEQLILQNIDIDSETVIDVGYIAKNIKWKSTSNIVKSMLTFGHFKRDKFKITFSTPAWNYVFNADWGGKSIIGFIPLADEWDKQFPQKEASLPWFILTAKANFQPADKRSSTDMYGDLFADNASIEVDYEKQDYTFLLKDEDNWNKVKIKNLHKLNIELDNQGDKRLKPYTIEELRDPTIIKLNFHATKSLEAAITKAENEAQNNNLSDQNSENDQPIIAQNASTSLNSQFLLNKNLQTDSNVLGASFFGGVILFVTLFWVLIKKFFFKKSK